MHILRKFRRVVCGISGGVDSAVAAYLLKKQKFEVIGIFMKNWDPFDEKGVCSGIEIDLQDARQVCNELKINLIEVSFVKEYWNNVFSELIEDYANAFTPNPDVLCNRFIKFGALYNYSRNELGADAIATGHYAQTSFGPYLQNYKVDTNVELLRGVDITKDQTLFLSQVSQESLRRTMFPLGQLFKYKVREIAQSVLKLSSVSKKKDSMGICFIGKRNFGHFINDYIKEKSGDIIDIETQKIIGRHSGIHHWTIGQGLKLGGFKNKLFVSYRDPITNTIYAAEGTEHPSLYSNELIGINPHWINSENNSFNSRSKDGQPLSCIFKFQHKDWVSPCQVFYLNENSLRIKLAYPGRAISPGQFATFYKKDVCLGSARISEVLMNSHYYGHINFKENDTNDSQSKKKGLTFKNS